MQIELTKTVTVLYDARTDLPFLLQIDKHDQTVAILSFVDRETTHRIEIPTGVVVYEHRKPKKFENEYSYVIHSTERYTVEWNGSVILDMKPLYGWYF